MPFGWFESHPFISWKKKDTILTPTTGRRQNPSSPKLSAARQRFRTHLTYALQSEWRKIFLVIWRSYGNNFIRSICNKLTSIQPRTFVGLFKNFCTLVTIISVVAGFVHVARERMFESLQRKNWRKYGTVSCTIILAL